MVKARCFSLFDPIIDVCLMSHNDCLQHYVGGGGGGGSQSFGDCGISDSGRHQTGGPSSSESHGGGILHMKSTAFMSFIITPQY